MIPLALSAGDWLGISGAITSMITAVAGAIVTIRHGWAIDKNTAKVDDHEDRITAMEPPEVQRKAGCSSASQIARAIHVEKRIHRKP